MERDCWEQFNHQYDPHGQLKAWADDQRVYQQWRRSHLAESTPSNIPIGRA
ncbi:MAG: hypothetical protein WBG32_22270 [Nodosilinea sp.]